MFGFGGRGGLVQFLFGTPIGPRQITLGEIAGRKALKGAVNDMMSAEDHNKKSIENHPVLEKLAFYNSLAKMSAIEKEAPFKSEAQRRKFYAMESRGEISKKEVRKWERETSDGKLPERIHKKEALLNLAVKAGIGLGKTLMKSVKPVASVAKTLFLPTTKLQGAVSTAAWSTHTGVQAARAHQPSIQRMQPQVPRVQGPPLQMAASVGDLIEMTKQSLAKTAALASPVARPINRVSKSVANGIPDNWLKRSTTGTAHLNVANDAPKALATAGDATLQRAGAGSNTHIQR
jgi:hypothetical protein